MVLYVISHPCCLLSILHSLGPAATTLTECGQPSPLHPLISFPTPASLQGSDQQEHEPHKCLLSALKVTTKLPHVATTLGITSWGTGSPSVRLGPVPHTWAVWAGFCQGQATLSQSLLGSGFGSQHWVVA